MKTKFTSYEDWISSQLTKLGLTKAICPHCGNDDPNLMAENWFFTHGGGHHALNYQCHNRPKCDNYFKIGPLSECTCGWDREEADIQKLAGYEWGYDHDDSLGWTYRKI